MSFELWLEFEEVNEKIEDFCNVEITLHDGKQYGLTVWTFNYLQRAIEADQVNGDHLHTLYIIPPDLFVQELSRACLERTITDLMKRGPLEEMLNPSVRFK